MRAYLRILAVLYAFGALVHYGNLLGFGERSWSEAPLGWKVADIAYAALDTAVVIGLWFGKAWGIICFLLAATSQLVLYIGFPQIFTLTQEHFQALQHMVIFHVLTLGIFFVLLWVKK